MVVFICVPLLKDHAVSDVSYSFYITEQMCVCVCVCLRLLFIYDQLFYPYEMLFTTHLRPHSDVFPSEMGFSTKNVRQDLILSTRTWLDHEKCLYIASD